MGYERVDRVEITGEYSVKGSIIDVFPVNLELPVRVEFFDDEIETIRFFNPDSQISQEKTNSCELLPAGEIVLSGEESTDLIEILNGNSYDSSLERPPWIHDFIENYSVETNNPKIQLLSQLQHAGLDELFHLVTEEKSFLDCFSLAPLTLVYPQTAVRERMLQIKREFHTLFEQSSKTKICLPVDKFLRDDLLNETNKVYYFDEVANLERTEGNNHSSLPDENVTIKDSSAGPIIIKSHNFRGRLGEIREYAKGIADTGGQVCITSPYSAQLNRLSGIFQNVDGMTIKVQSEKRALPLQFKKKGIIYIARAALRHGFSIPDLNFHLWSDADIFGRSYKRRTRFKKTLSAPLDSFIDLKENDCVVHVNHGVGRFLKLERVCAAGRERDFLVLEYADRDRLYVPLDQISMVQRYISPNDKPRLDSLGKSSFKRIKERVEKRIEELAGELIQLYAIRMSRKGYTFPPDTLWQEEFEADFQYEETPDQISAIEAVKNDMETSRPMDRLICGDVGYGKTEVAIRAAFKAVIAGKQTAIIVPTTILALQHFTTFKERFRNYPINLDIISRFRTRSEITAIKKKLAAGEIDVIIGTHALFAEDIRMKNLGLFIIDEEQRFGVVHKETIKKYKKTVDVITLSATPIPRTLHMSLVGIRDLSIIQTPPQDRLPVRTYVIKNSDSVLKEAIFREIERRGQVFYLHNRVDTIEYAAERIRSLLPQVSLTILHGQMHEENIEDTLLDFLNKKYDVLVTTTIIESGIDMPNVNTLIVDRADTFGLSQLYQIRGRVGRSNRQAYAYLFYPTDRIMNEKAQRRLNTIQEYQELGSGFKIAMRDLEIRGAGNILGKEQSGDIMDVGFELYVKLLDKAVNRLKGTHQDEEIRCILGLNDDFFLPEEYIPDTRQRIEFYKRFEAAVNIQEVEKLASEMNDRFGKAPEYAANFIKIEKIRTLAQNIGFESIFEEESGRIRLMAGDNIRIPSEHVINTLKEENRLKLVPGNPGVLYFEPGAKKRIKLQELTDILFQLALPIHKKEDA